MRDVSLRRRAPARRRRIPVRGAGRVPARVAGLALALALAASACQPERRQEPTGVRTNGPAADAHGVDADAGTPGAPGSEGDAMSLIGDSLRFTLHAPAHAAPGEAVPIELRLTNIASETVTVHLLGREIAFDVEVRDASGDLVWRRLEGEIIPQILQVRILAPGETLTLRDVWTQRTNQGRPVPAGTYLLQGVLPTEEPEPLRTGTSRLEIRAR